jgi:hypothetical protein
MTLSLSDGWTDVEEALGSFRRKGMIFGYDCEARSKRHRCHLAALFDFPLLESLLTYPSKCRYESLSAIAH